MFAIKEMRKRAKMTQADVAEKLGLTENGYYKWEHEERDISLKDAMRLAELFDCTLDELAGYSPPSGGVITQDERQIIDLYRSTDARGRTTIFAVAQAQRGIDPVRATRSA